MFPLGSVLLPTMVLPLHVFEPRYRALVRHCLGGEGEPEFGVVLIARGSEVGGDDVRTNVGTVARIVEVGELPDGRFVLATVGTRRIRVEEWLPDDPWPRALVSDLLDDVPAGEASAELWVGVRTVLRRVLGLATELGEEVAPLTTELSDDPAVGSFQAAALAPLGPVDRQATLPVTDVDERLVLVEQLLRDQEELLEARLHLR
jgi:Lon protease-like protein